mmetsp:Transcript_32213/g.75920  ORF Transcript_32213/g.75920 Transcript_32213/m.75920 type:complete len:125 (-) Transcript_32213:307-681(-)
MHWSALPITSDSNIVKLPKLFAIERALSSQMPASGIANLVKRRRDVKHKEGTRDGKELFTCNSVKTGQLGSVHSHRSRVMSASDCNPSTTKQDSRGKSRQEDIFRKPQSERASEQYICCLCVSM